MSERYIYVAADPSQPGAAYAGFIDDGKRREELAETISEWIIDGADVMRVPADTAKTMLGEWVHPNAR